MTFEDIIHDAETRRENVINGGYNCIPLPYNRFRSIYPGTEQEKYIIVTANQKIGKTKLADNLYMYEPIFFMVEHPEIKINIYCFSLEITPKIKYYDFLSYLLYRLDGICISTSDLKSTNKDRPLNPEILDILKQDKYQVYVKKWEECVTFITDIKNPTGIYKKIRGFMLERGQFHYKKGTIKDENGLPMEVDVIDYFEHTDEDEYIEVILDNYSNLMQEQGMDKRATIEKMSKYAIELRDKFDIHFCAIQHQALCACIIQIFLVSLHYQKKYYRI